MLRVYEGQTYPWWGRVWRYNYKYDSRDVLVIPLCWLARAAWKLWCWSFSVRATSWERELCKARQAGFAEGIARKSEVHREVAEDLFARMIAALGTGGGSATPNTELG